MKTQLDFCTTIPNLSSNPEDTMVVSITNYSDGPIMSVTQDSRRITLNRAEITQLLDVFNKYEMAQAVLEGEKS